MSSSDGGKSWRPLAAWPYPQKRSFVSGVIAAKGQSLWEFALRGVLRSADDGRTFTEIALPTQRIVPQSLAFVDASHGWLLAQGVIYATADGGTVWKQVAFLR